MFTITMTVEQCNRFENEIDTVTYKGKDELDALTQFIKDFHLAWEDDDGNLELPQTVEEAHSLINDVEDTFVINAWIGVPVRYKGIGIR